MGDRFCRTRLGTQNLGRLRQNKEVLSIKRGNGRHHEQQCVNDLLGKRIARARQGEQKVAKRKNKRLVS